MNTLKQLGLIIELQMVKIRTTLSFAFQVISLCLTLEGAKLILFLC